MSDTKPQDANQSGRSEGPRKRGRPRLAEKTGPGKDTKTKTLYINVEPRLYNRLNRLSENIRISLILNCPKGNSKISQRGR